MSELRWSRVMYVELQVERCVSLAVGHGSEDWASELLGGSIAQKEGLLLAVTVCT